MPLLFHVLNRRLIRTAEIGESKRQLRALKNMAKGLGEFVLSSTFWT